ncbi:MAG: zinc-binding dehydrogenase [Bacillota bacterium]
MKTKAAVLYGKKDIRIREFDLPEIKEDELLVKVVSNSICLSTYKAALLGSDHKRVPDTINKKPIMTGHEFSGEIVKVGNNLKDEFSSGQNFVLQPAMGLESGYSPGYSYETFGGNATYTIIPKVAIDLGCVLPMKDDYFANASLAEPMSCIIGAFNANYHTTPYVYEHDMGIKEGGNLALLGATGPMGIGAIDFAINGKINPKSILVTDINQERLDRAKKLISEKEAEKKGIELIYLNTKNLNSKEILDIIKKDGFDDVFVFAAVKELLTQADNLLGNDGCLNFFAGPTDKEFKVPFNFYHVHYSSTHLVGTSGGSTDDMLESLKLSSDKKINPSYMITHIGGLNAAPETIVNLKENNYDGKCLIYPHIDMDLTAIDDFEKLGKNNKLFKKLDSILKNNNGIWCKEAEDFLLNYKTD